MPSYNIRNIRESGVLKLSSERNYPGARCTGYLIKNYVLILSFSSVWADNPLTALFKRIFGFPIFGQDK